MVGPDGNPVCTFISRSGPLDKRSLGHLFRAILLDRFAHVAVMLHSDVCGTALGSWKNTLDMVPRWRKNFLRLPSMTSLAQPSPRRWRKRFLGTGLSFTRIILLVVCTLYDSCNSLVSGHTAAASTPGHFNSAPFLRENDTFVPALSELTKRGEATGSVLELMLNSPTQLNNPQDEEDTINGKLKKDTRAVNALHEKSITRDELHRKKATRDAEELSSEWPDSSRTMDDSTLAVFTRPGCPYSEEALREAELAQIMVRNLGGALKVVNVDTKQERDLAKLLGIKTVPCLRYYRDANLRSASHSTYEGINVSADEIAHWVLLHQGKTVQSASVRQSAFRMAPFRGSAVGPVVRASVHEGSPRAALVLRLSKNTEELPSRFTLFNIEYIDPSEREEFRVYRKQLPFDVGEEEFLTLEDTQWEPKSILALMLEAENRKVFYGDKPPPVLLGERALLSVYVSRFENLQDIAWLLMEFHEAYRDRIAFHIARSTLKEAARSQDTFSHTWGGAVLTDQRPNTSAYQKVAGVVRELSPFSQYSLSMPFNYHSMLSFLEEWSAGKPELHFRSNRLTYSEKESQVMELNHLQFLNVLQRANRVHFGVLYYEPECSDCQIYLEAWKAAAEAFNTAEALKGRLLFGQVNAHVNDIIDFDMKEKIPSIAVYPEGLQALDKRILYTGPPLVNSLLDFLGRLAAKQEEL